MAVDWSASRLYHGRQARRRTENRRYAAARRASKGKGAIRSWAKNVLRDRTTMSCDQPLLPTDWIFAEVTWSEGSLYRPVVVGRRPHPRGSIDWLRAYGIELHAGDFEKAFPAETFKSIEELDRALYPEITALLVTGKKPYGAALSLAVEGKVAGTGSEETKAKRLSARYTKEVLRSP
jgi:hypothetical protein